MPTGLVLSHSSARRHVCWLAPALLLLVGSLSLLLVASWSALTPAQPNACDQTPASSEAIPVDVPRVRSRGSWSSEFRLHLLASLQLPRHGESLPTVPLLFVHGHRGSYRQARDLSVKLNEGLPFDYQRTHNSGALSADPHSPSSWADLLDPAALRPAHFALYSIDFGEDAGNNAALEAGLMQQQAAFVNDAIDHLQKLYNGSRIQSVGLSVGGVVLRLAVLRPDHPLCTAAPSTTSTTPWSHSCLSTIYTLNTPHRAHPAFVEPAMSALYGRLNRAWASEFVIPDEPSPLLSQLSLVSFSGGTRDRQVRSDLGALDGIAPPSHALHVYTSSMDGVHMEIDHDSVAWCAQFLAQLARAIQTVASADMAWVTQPESQRHRMPLLRALLEPKTPTQLHLRSSQPWRLSTPLDGEVTPTIALSSADSRQLAISSSTPVVLSSPADRNFSSLHRPVQVELSAAATCASSFPQHPVREHATADSGIYSIKMEGESATTPSVHLIPLPSGDFDQLVLLTNIPSQHVCASLWTGDKDAPAFRVNPWLVDLPPHAPSMRLVPVLTPDDQLVHRAQHVWHTSATSMAQQPRSLLTLRRADIPANVRHVELSLLLSEESRWATLWVRVQFTPPSESTTTRVRRRWWGGLEATVARTMLLALPSTDSFAPNPSIVSFESSPIVTVGAHSSTSVAGPPSPAFGPLVYTASLPSGEAFWQIHLADQPQRFHIPSTHLTTQPQTTHTLMLLDPAFEYRVRVSPDLVALLGQQLLAWHGVIFAALFAFLVMGLLFQIQSYARAADQGHKSHTRSVLPIYMQLAHHWLHSAGVALLLCLLASAVRAMIGVRNIGVEASLLLSFVYGCVGWSLAVALDFTVGGALRLAVHGLAAVRQRCFAPSATPPPMRQASSSNLHWLFAMCICIAAVAVPLHLLAFSLVAFIGHHVLKQSTLRLSGTCPSRMSTHRLSRSIIVLLTLVVLLRAPSIYQQSAWGWRRWSVEQLVPSDSFYAGICVLLLLQLSRVDRISFGALDLSPSPTGGSSPGTLVLHATLLYRMLLLLVLFAFYFTRVHFHQTLLLVAAIAASLLCCPAVQWYERIRTRCFISPAPIHHDADATSFAVADAAPALGRLDRVIASPVPDDLELQSLLDDETTEEAQPRHALHNNGRQLHDSVFG